jgi:atypical dual specificity phosphatase
VPLFNFTWIKRGKLGACSLPAFDPEYAALRRDGITLLVNLQDDAHAPETLERFGLRELHLPVTDFSPPTQEQITQAIAAIEAANAAGEAVAVHCVAGIGRTGTVVACWLVTQGMTAEVAIERIRELRPGSVETPEQVAAVQTFARGQPA